jgi:hypothetical protein
MLVAYEDLVRSPNKAVSALVDEIKQVCNAGLEVPDQKTINDFITDDLHRQRIDSSDADIFLSQPQRDLWQLLRSGEFPRDEESTGISASTRQHLRDLEARMIAVEQLRTQLKATEKAVRTLEAQLRSKDVESKQQKANLESTIAALQASLSWRITAPLRIVWGLFRSEQKVGRAPPKR